MGKVGIDLTVRPEDKIVILSMYKDLTFKAQKVIDKLGIPIDLVEVELTNFIDIAKAYKEKGKEIIVTRGGIGGVLKCSIDMHVIEISITGYDILKAMMSFKDHDGPIGVFGTDKVCSGSKVVAEQLGIDVVISFQVMDIHPTYEEIVKITREMQKKGLRNVIGMSIGDDTKKHFSKYGIDYKLIESEEISVLEAVQNAIALSEMTIKDVTEKERFKAVVNVSSEGIISVDQFGRIVMMNPVGAKMLKRQAVGDLFDSLALGFDIKEALEFGGALEGHITKLNGVQVMSEVIPITVSNNVHGAVITIKEVRHIQKAEQNIRFKLAQRGLAAKYTFQSIKGTSARLGQVIDLAKRYSRQVSTVLITGESGTGKEVFAQAIHNSSSRKDQAFVAVNCSALSATLLESELFGYSDGAFTGARKGGKQGLFELAHNGTIFLDEVGELDQVSQGRLLRVIQEREVRRIGDDKVIPVDVRVIAATNKDLYQEVEDGKFRLDLYFRLDVLNLHIPPLRERLEDLNGLVEALLENLNMRLDSQVTGLDDEILTLFRQYDWPGNIRELRNVLEKIVVITEAGEASYQDVVPVLQRLVQRRAAPGLGGTLDEIEREIIAKILTEEGNNKTQAAKRLGITRKTLSKKLIE